MADLLLLCLTEDEVAAQSIAAPFERAGLAVEGCDGTDAEIAAAPAVLVLWTPAAARSAGMLAAAQRVAKSGKGLFATFGAVRTPPPGGKAFDLARWSGDPDDEAIDGLFVAVDRLVTRNRELVLGNDDRMAEAPEPRAKAAPRPAPAPPPPTAPVDRLPDPPRPAERAPSAADRLAEEAAAWRSVRTSREPADYERFIATYGETSTFAELAALKLQQLRPVGRSARPDWSERTDRPAPPPPVQGRDALFSPPPARERAGAFDLSPRLDLPPVEEPRRRGERREKPAKSGGGGLAVFAATFLLVLGGIAVVAMLRPADFGLNGADEGRGVALSVPEPSAARGPAASASAAIPEPPAAEASPAPAESVADVAAPAAPPQRAATASPATPRPSTPQARPATSAVEADWRSFDPSSRPGTAASGQRFSRDELAPDRFDESGRDLNAAYVPPPPASPAPAAAIASPAPARAIAGPSVDVLPEEPPPTASTRSPFGYGPSQDDGGGGGGPAPFTDEAF